jgi:hypothetical protein
LLTKVRTLIHEEISLLTVLKIPFRARTPISSALSEQASNNNGPEGAKAKEIFLGIDAHLRSNQVARKID